MRASHCGWKLGEHARDLAEVGAVVPLVRAGAVGEGDLAAGHRLLHDLGDLPDPVVLVVPADVEGLGVHRARAGRVRTARKARLMSSMCTIGRQGRAVALEQHLARGEGPGDEVVEHDVEAQPRRDAVGRGAAQEGGAEGVVGQLGRRRAPTRTFDSP